jgi:hypothetical protein
MPNISKSKKIHLSGGRSDGACTENRVAGACVRTSFCGSASFQKSQEASTRPADKNCLALRNAVGQSLQQKRDATRTAKRVVTTHSQDFCIRTRVARSSKQASEWSSTRADGTARPAANGHTETKLAHHCAADPLVLHMLSMGM